MLNKVERNCATVTGRNVGYVEGLLGPKIDLYNISKKEVKSKVIFCEMSKDDNWKVNLIKEATNLKQGKLSFDSVLETDNPFSKEELNFIIDFVSSG